MPKILCVTGVRLLSGLRRIKLSLKALGNILKKTYDDIVKKKKKKLMDFVSNTPLPLSKSPCEWYNSHIVHSAITAGTMKVNG